MLSSRDLRCPRTKISGAFVRQAARTTSFIRCCASPNDKPKKKASSIPRAPVFNVTCSGEVHIHIGDGRGQAADWDAVAISPEAKALLQKHAVKASTALKMHNVLGFEDVDDLQRLSSDLIAQLKLKPLQLEPLVHMLRDHQKQQDASLIVGMQGQQQQQQQEHHHQEKVMQGQAQQDLQQGTGQSQGAGQPDATPSPAENIFASFWAAHFT